MRILPVLLGQGCLGHGHYLDNGTVYI